ncbi:MAG: hypothetical protein IJJ30_06475 [Erysipelotrichaceae bacterium]|nr:hypothetical protein [Erysipelotrichaceae bacterium]
MKKVYAAGILSLLFCAVGTLINYLYYRENNHLLLCFRTYGGEITIEHGFALRAVHIYGMTPDAVTTHSLRFSPIGMLATLLVSFGILLLILTLAGRLLKK